MHKPLDKNIYMSYTLFIRYIPVVKLAKFPKNSPLRKTSVIPADVLYFPNFFEIMLALLTSLCYNNIRCG